MPDCDRSSMFQSSITLNSNCHSVFVRSGTSAMGGFNPQLP